MRKEAFLRLHQLLLHRRDELAQSLEQDSAGAASSREPHEDDDMPPEDETATVASPLAALELAELLRIDGALHRMRTGRYGRCDDCHRPIPVTRLNALPYTELCHDCQRKREEQETEDDE